MFIFCKQTTIDVILLGLCMFIDVTILGLCMFLKRNCFLYFKYKTVFKIVSLFIYKIYKGLCIF